MSAKSELEELRRIRSQQREENDQQRLNDLKKENEKKKKEDFLAKAKMFEQKKGPTDEEKKQLIQKAAMKRKFEKQLKKTIQNSENKNPMALEFQLRNGINNTTTTTATTTTATESNTTSSSNDWELIQQAGGPDYYWNRLTNETAYELPSAELKPRLVMPHQIPNNTNNDHDTYESQIMNNEVEEPQSLSSTENTSNDDQGWLLCQYQDGSHYYWNYLTNETVLNLPSHLDPNNIPPYIPEEETPVERELTPDDKLQAESNRDNWTTEWDEYYQANYYRNLVTETLRWDPPECFASPSQETVQQDSSDQLFETTNTTEVISSSSTETLERLEHSVDSQLSENTSTESHQQPPPPSPPTSEAKKIENPEPSSHSLLDNQDREDSKSLDQIERDTSASLPPTLSQQESKSHEQTATPQSPQQQDLDTKTHASTSLPITEQNTVSDNPLHTMTPSPPPPPPPPPPRKLSVESTIAPVSKETRDEPTPIEKVASTSTPPPPAPLSSSSPSSSLSSSSCSSSEIVNDHKPVEVSTESPTTLTPRTPPVVENKKLDSGSSHHQIDSVVPELEIDSEKHEPDDDLLVGDGSKPVGCSSCVVS